MQNKLIKNIIKTGAIISLSSPLVGLVSCGKLQDWQKWELVEKYAKDNYSIDTLKTFLYNYQYSSPFMEEWGGTHGYLVFSNPREKKWFDKQWTSLGFDGSHLKKIENISGVKIRSAKITMKYYVGSSNKHYIAIGITLCGVADKLAGYFSISLSIEELISEDEEWNKLWHNERWISMASELNFQKVYYSKLTEDLVTSYNYTYNFLKEVSGGAIREFTDEYKNMALKSIGTDVYRPSASHFKVLFAGGDQTHYEYDLYLYYENPVKDSIYDYIHLDEPIKVRIAKS